MIRQSLRIYDKLERKRIMYFIIQDAKGKLSSELKKNTRSIPFCLKNRRQTHAQTHIQRVTKIGESIKKVGLFWYRSSQLLPTY